MAQRLSEGSGVGGSHAPAGWAGPGPRQGWFQIQLHVPDCPSLDTLTSQSLRVLIREVGVTSPRTAIGLKRLRVSLGWHCRQGSLVRVFHSASLPFPQRSIKPSSSAEVSRAQTDFTSTLQTLDQRVT